MTDEPKKSADIVPLWKDQGGPERPWSRHIWLLFDLIALLDSGKYQPVDVEAMKEAIATATVDQLLKKLADNIDLTPYSPAHWAVLHAEWQDMEAIDERKRWGIRENGICLLAAYLVLSLQRRLGERAVPPS